MRKLLTSIFLMLAISTLAQVPQGFNYQAVIRNSSGELITEQDVSVRISILQGSTTGSPVYTETHSVQTNTFGLINLVIGQGESSDDFSTVDWSNNPYYLKIELDVNGSTDYVYFGTSQLLSVPYAMYAEETGNVDDADANPTNELQVLSISNDTIYLSQGSFVKLPTASVPQQFSVSEFGDTLYLSNGNHIIIPGASINNYNYTKHGVFLEDFRVLNNEGVKGFTMTNDENLVFLLKSENFNFSFKKIDTLGQEIWTKSYDIDTIEHINYYERYIHKTNDGGYISFFNAESVNYNFLDILVKSDVGGDTLWTRSMEFNCKNIYQTSDNKYLVGTSKNIETTSYSMLAKLDEIGDTIWTKTYNSIEYGGATISNILETSDGNYLFSTILYNSYENKLFKTNSSGDTLWTWKIELGSQISSISETSDNKYLIIKSRNNGPIITKLDTDKSVIWSKEYVGGDDYNNKLNKVFNLNNGDIIAVGGYRPNGDDSLFGNTHGEYDIWVLRINASGEVINSTFYGGSDDEYLGNAFYLTNNRLLIISSARSSDGNVPINSEYHGLWIFTLSTN